MLVNWKQSLGRRPHQQQRLGFLKIHFWGTAFFSPNFWRVKSNCWAYCKSKLNYMLLVELWLNWLIYWYINILVWIKNWILLVCSIGSKKTYVGKISPGLRFDHFVWSSNTFPKKQISLGEIRFALWKDLTTCADNKIGFRI